MNDSDQPTEGDPSSEPTPASTPKPPPTQAGQFDVSIKQIFADKPRDAVTFFMKDRIKGPVTPLNTDAS